MNKNVNLKNIPKELEKKLFEEYKKIKKQYTLQKWGPSQVNAGRLVEILLRIFQSLLGEKITPLDKQIKNKEKVFNKAENSKNINSHIRTKILPLSKLLKDFRNNRDAAHINGFNANNMDANFIKTTSDWIISELIRVFGNVPMKTAEKISKTLVSQNYPVITNIKSQQVISKPNLNSDEEILILLYKNKEGVTFEFLFNKTKDSNKTRFQNKLNKMKSKKLLTKIDGEYFLLPKGIEIIEKEKLLEWS